MANRSRFPGSPAANERRSLDGARARVGPRDRSCPTTPRPATSWTSRWGLDFAGRQHLRTWRRPNGTRIQELAAWRSVNPPRSRWLSCSHNNCAGSPDDHECDSGRGPGVALKRGGLGCRSKGFDFKSCFCARVLIRLFGTEGITRKKIRISASANLDARRISARRPVLTEVNLAVEGRR